MAHFAQLDENNNVIACNVIANSDCLDDDGNESEAVGILFCKSLWGNDTTWKQTSYNGNFRKNYGTVGCVYDSTKDAFIPIKEFSSWVLNETTCKWEAPVTYPDDGELYRWNEASTNWVLC